MVFIANSHCLFSRDELNSKKNCFVSLGHPEFVEFLIQNGAYVGAWDLGGDTALHHASKWRNKKKLHIFKKNNHFVESNLLFQAQRL